MAPTERAHTHLPPSCRYIQSRFYRAPEVILGKPYGPPIDIFSLGCVLAELLTGAPLFPGEDEVEQLACLMEVLGVPPRRVTAGAVRLRMFFDIGGHLVCGGGWGSINP